MPDQTTLNHAAQVLASIAADKRADTALRFYFESHRYLQPPAKRHISRAVFAYFRWFSWLDPKASPQKRLEHAADLHERFAADPKSIKAESLAALAVPQWIWSELDFPTADSPGKAPSSGPAPSSLQPPTSAAAKAAWLRQLQREPALWLRARPGQAAALAKSLFAAELADPSTFNFQLSTGGTAAVDAVRFNGTQDLFKTEQFKTGEFEIQDLASQFVGIACAPVPGETWWDACAGEGGKALHLADLMKNKGVVWASDRNAKRLDTLKRRMARAKLFNYRTAPWDGGAKLPTKTRFDGVLLDAPCSGVGTWQRNPHARWTTTLEDVRELAATQAALLNHIAPSLKPGGRLVYSVCTLTRSETTAVADAFTTAHPDFEPSPVFAAADRPSPIADRLVAPSVMLLPHELNANGMFIAAWRRKPA